MQAEKDAAARKAACEAKEEELAKAACKADEKCLKDAPDVAKAKCAVTEAERAAAAAAKAEQVKACQDRVKAVHDKALSDCAIELAACKKKAGDDAAAIKDCEAKAAISKTNAEVPFTTEKEKCLKP